MAKFTSGTPITYGSNDKGTGNLNGVVMFSITDTNDDSVVFRGEMYASEIRLAYEADNNQAVDGNGEVVSHCTYNQRKVLSLTGVILSNNAPSSVPTGAASTIAKANLMFSAPFKPGMRLDVNIGSWLEVNSADLGGDSGFISENQASQTSGGLGNFTIQSAEKTRSSGNYAEWTISAIEYINVVNTGSDTSDN